MGSSFSVAVTMSAETVETLQKLGVSLCAFRCVQGPLGAKPVVWFQSATFELVNTISWTEEYQAYTSRTEAIPAGQLVAVTPYPVEPGQVLQVTSPTGSGLVTGQGGVDGQIGFDNRTSIALTAGISVARSDGTYQPVCVFPLPGNAMRLLAPVEKIFLMFGSALLNTGAVVVRSYGPALLVDLTGAYSRSVTYDATTGWSWPGQAAWAVQVAHDEDLISLLTPPAP